jgi:GT2 family glycosyltransferase
MRTRGADQGWARLNDWSPWRVVDVHLDGEVPLLPAADGIGGILAVFWHGQIPLGQRRFLAAELPLSPAHLRDIGIDEIAGTVLHNLAMVEAGRMAETDASGTAARLPGLREVLMCEAPLRRLRERLTLAETAGRGLSSSVVICTRDRPDALAMCLASVMSQLGPVDEVIVVDNAPSSERARAIVARHQRARYVLEPRPGLDVARNAGIRGSDADVVVFCDDDVEVHPDWLQRIKAPFHDGEVAAVTGLVLPASMETEAQYAFETHWGFNRGCRIRVFGSSYFARHRRAGVPAWEIGAGASMAFRRILFQRLGGFDERLDVGAAGCSGDSEMWYRIMAAGYTCRYEPSAVSYHHHRRQWPELRRQMFGYMRGHAAALLVQFERHRHYGNLRRLLFSLPWYYMGKIGRLALGGDRRRLRTLGDEIRGWLSGIGFYLRQPRQAPPSVFLRGPP